MFGGDSMPSRVPSSQPQNRGRIREPGFMISKSRYTDPSPTPMNKQRRRLPTFTQAAVLAGRVYVKEEGVLSARPEQSMAVLTTLHREPRCTVKPSFFVFFSSPSKTCSGCSGEQRRRLPLITPSADGRGCRNKDADSLPCPAMHHAAPRRNQRAWCKRRLLEWPRDPL